MIPITPCICQSKKMRRSPWFHSARHLGNKWVTCIYRLYRFLINLISLWSISPSRKQRKSCKRQRRQPLSQSTVERRQPGHGVSRGEIEIRLVSNGSETNNPISLVQTICGLQKTACPIRDVKQLPLVGSMKPGKSPQWSLGSNCRHDENSNGLWGLSWLSFCQDNGLRVLGLDIHASIYNYVHILWLCTIAYIQASLELRTKPCWGKKWGSKVIADRILKWGIPPSEPTTAS